MGIGFALAALIALLVASPAAAAYATRFVDDDGRAGRHGCDGNRVVPTSIQQAVDSASPRTTIVVCPGTYVGQVTITTNQITIIGARPWTAVVMPSEDHPSNNSLIMIDGASRVRIQWLRVEARTAAPCEQVGGMITVFNSPMAQIRANKIGPEGTDTFGPCGYESGVRLINSPDSTIAWNTITDFKSAGVEGRDTPTGLRIHDNNINFFHETTAPLAFLGQAGIIVQNTPGARVNRNRVRSLPTAGISTPSVGDGILAYDAAVTMRQNIVRYAQTAIGVLVTNGGLLADNVVRDAVVQGIVIGNSQNLTLSGNSSTGGNGRGIYLWSSSVGNTISDGNFSGNGGTDCTDESTGGGTSGTSNTWTNNIGSESDPAGICAPAV